MYSGDVIGVINDLIEVSKDGEEGFRACADNVKDLRLKTFFDRKAVRCREGAEQLQQIVREMGADPEEKSSASGAMHRFWIAIRGTLAGRSEHAILEECERGEDTARGIYEHALRQNLPPAVRSVVERQYVEVRANHERIKALRDMAAAG